MFLEPRKQLNQTSISPYLSSFGLGDSLALEGKLRVTLDLALNHPIPWPIYDQEGLILVKQGEILYSQKQVKLLLERSAYFLEGHEHKSVKLPDQQNFQNTGLKRVFKNPFHHIDQLAEELAFTFNQIRKKSPGAVARLKLCYEMVEELIERDAEAALGAIHLYRKHKNAISKPLYSGLLAEMLCRRLNYEAFAKQTVVSACMVCNIASLTYQSKLDMQSEPLTEEQIRKVKKHPEESVLMLHTSHFDNKYLLEIILQHHERSDGSGYPRRLTGSQIQADAKMIALVEFYTAVTAKRNYRATLQAKDALRAVYKNARDDEMKLHLAFIKELGVYPPGTFVRLNNGEIAIVTKRQPFSIAPMVKVVMGSQGTIYEHPASRDCTIDNFKIAEAYHMTREIKINFPQLWDYD